ncbi:MAG: hypothetical protein R3F02_19170 [Thiolinea sp.]
MKRMDKKLANIQAGQYTPADFIIADAKDGDMAFGIPTPGPEKDADGELTGRYLPLKVYRDDMEKVIEADQADIMLTSLSTAEYLTRKGVYHNTPVTPAVRLNDCSDIWFGRGANYSQQPMLPFRSARLDRVKPVADLGLYAVTFYTDLEADRRTLDAFAQFRDEASAQGIRYFLEVFNPHFAVQTPGADFASYNNDMIARCLAGISHLDRPLFLKMAYNGPRAMEDLASYDPENLIVGILGGAAGTTRDCLELIKQAERYGARVALFGRKIYFAENSVLMIRAMRRVLEAGISSEEATKAYHDDLNKAGLRPHRALKDDLQITEEILKGTLV